MDEEMAAQADNIDLDDSAKETESSSASSVHHEVPSLTTLSAALKQKFASTHTSSTESAGAVARSVDGSGDDSCKEKEDTATSTPRPNSAKRTKSNSPFGESSQFHFFSGNPTVEKTEGIIHLYKRE